VDLHPISRIAQHKHGVDEKQSVVWHGNSIKISPIDKRSTYRSSDNETVAENVVPAGAHFVDFKAAERGVYHLDRAEGVEYIHFSTRPGRPSNEVKLNLGRSRSKPRKTT
jgi:hypothetical protein